MELEWDVGAINGWWCLYDIHTHRDRELRGVRRRDLKGWIRHVDGRWKLNGPGEVYWADTEEEAKALLVALVRMS